MFTQIRRSRKYFRKVTFAVRIRQTVNLLSCCCCCCCCCCCRCFLYLFRSAIFYFRRNNFELRLNRSYFDKLFSFGNVRFSLKPAQILKFKKLNLGLFCPTNFVLFFLLQIFVFLYSNFLKHHLIVKTKQLSLSTKRVNRKKKRKQAKENQPQQIKRSKAV